MIDETPFPWPPTPDTHAAIIRTVQRWNALLDVDASQHPEQNIESSGADTATAAAVAVAEPPSRARGALVLRAAARRAQQVYPGAAGELIRRELLAVADFNYGPIGETSMVTRLADQILTANLLPTHNDRSQQRGASRT